MLSYCIFLTIVIVGAMLAAAAELSVLLGNAFREKPTLVPDDATPDTAGGPNRVLAYAPPAEKRNLFRRWPLLAGCGVLLSDMVIFLGPPIAPAIYLWTQMGILAPYGVAAVIAAILGILGITVVVWRALRRVNGRPAVADWRSRKLLLTCAAWAVVCVLTLLALDWRTRVKLRELRQQANVQSQALHIAVRSGEQNAADVYREASALMTGDPAVPEWTPRVRSMPPSLTPELEKAVGLLHRAAAMKVADWGIAPPSMTGTVPHLKGLQQAAKLLRIHAAQEAHANRMPSAIADIRGLEAMARHAGQGQLVVVGLVAIWISAKADSAVEDVLPFVRNERELDALAARNDGWERQLRERMFKGEQAWAVQLMVDAYEGKIGAIPVRGGESIEIQLMRAFIAESDVAGLQRSFALAIEAAGHDPDRSAAMFHALHARSMPDWAALKQTGLLAPFLVPGLGRAGGKGIELEVSGQLRNVGLAVRRMVLRDGRWPTSLSELVDREYLMAIPRDPFSGKPILMKVTDEGAVVYSVGVDGRDDGGDVLNGRDVTFEIGNRPLWEKLPTTDPSAK